MYRQNSDLTKLFKSVRKLRAHLSAGQGGVQSLFGQCPNRRNRWTDFWNGTFLSDSTHVQLQPSHLIVSASLLHQCVCPNVIVSQLLIFTRFTRTKSVLQTTKKHNLFGSCCQLTWDWDVCGNIFGVQFGVNFPLSGSCSSCTPWTVCTRREGAKKIQYNQGFEEMIAFKVQRKILASGPF